MLVDDQFTFNARSICARGGVSLNGADVNIQSNSPGITTYKISAKKYAAEIAAKTRGTPIVFPAYTDGEFPREYTYYVERFFTLNMGGEERNQLVKAEERYVLPISINIPSAGSRPPDGNVTNKVKNIFNLDNFNELKVKFRRIGRKIKGMDNYFQLYKPNAFGSLSRSIGGPIGGPSDPVPRYWHCYDTITGLESNPPNYFKWLNEMVFRGFYGSVDGAEFKGKFVAESKEATNWVPYDYM